MSFIRACVQVDEAAVSACVAEGADVNEADKWLRTPLHEAVRYAYKDEEAALRIVTLLIERGAAVNVHDKSDGHTPLMEAAIYGYPKILALLIERGAEVNARAKGKKTAIGLIEAAASLKTKRKRILKMLADAGGTL